MGILITLLLGLFILIGAGIAYYGKSNKKFIEFSLGLAFGVMIMLMLTDLLPEAWEKINDAYSNSLSIILLSIGIFFGYFILKMLDVFIPDHEGHDDDNLEHIGIMSAVILVIHNIIEGMAVANAVNSSVKSGLLLSVGIGLHNIPMGMVISSILFKSSKDKVKNATIIGGVSISTAIGGVLTFLATDFFENSIVNGTLLSLTIGMIIFISLCELLPKIISLKDKKTALKGIELGIVLLIITMFI